MSGKEKLQPAREAEESEKQSFRSRVHSLLHVVHSVRRIIYGLKPDVHERGYVDAWVCCTALSPPRLHSLVAKRYALLGLGRDRGNDVQQSARPIKLCTVVHSTTSATMSGRVSYLRRGLMHGSEMTKSCPVPCTNHFASRKASPGSRLDALSRFSFHLFYFMSFRYRSLAL
jgi:hypothetical protein